MQIIPNVPGLMRVAPAPPRQLPPELMLRSFDFGVSPGQTYRYRARVVVNARPRFGRLKEVTRGVESTDGRRDRAVILHEVHDAS